MTPLTRTFSLVAPCLPDFPDLGPGPAWDLLHPCPAGGGRARAQALSLPTRPQHTRIQTEQGMEQAPEMWRKD